MWEKAERQCFLIGFLRWDFWKTQIKPTASLEACPASNSSHCLFLFHCFCFCAGCVWFLLEPLIKCLWTIHLTITHAWPHCCLLHLLIWGFVLYRMKLSFAFLSEPSPCKDTNSGNGGLRAWEFQGQEEIRCISAFFSGVSTPLTDISPHPRHDLHELPLLLAHCLPSSPTPSHLYKTSLLVFMTKLLRHGKDESLQ